MHEWSLDILYKGYEDENFQQDMLHLQTAVDHCNNLAKQLDPKHEKETCIAILKAMEELKLIAQKLMNFTSLKQSVNTADGQSVSYMDQITRIYSDSSKAVSAFQRFIAQMKSLDACIEEDAFLKEYAYLLKETKEDGKYQLSDEVEEVIAKLDRSGGSAWDSLQSYLTSTLVVPYGDGKTTLSQIRNFAYDSDPAVRKSAYEAELASYQNIRDAIAFSLNNIKSQVSTICELRGFDSPLAMTLHQSKMKQETLDTMFATIEKYMPVFHSYLRRKAEVLGYKNGLPWYELFAPIGKEDCKYSIEEAKEYLIHNFSPFAQDMSDMMKQAFEENWIDFYPRNGKVGGAFCSNLAYVKQSRVLTNYDGALGDIVTLAHELGHAYHGMMIQDHRILNTEYSMPVAETASTFNENIMMNTLIQEAQGDKKIALIENQLQDLTQVICDIYSRFLFEKEVFERRKKGFMFADELEEIMLDAQRKAYGDGLDSTYLHPYMWICKSHYYSSGLSFYNFPYSFGALFARGLVVKYQEQGEAFVTKYRKLLTATTISSAEDCAKIADIDLSDSAFWESSLKTCEARIQEFLDLTKKACQ